MCLLICFFDNVFEILSKNLKVGLVVCIVFNQEYSLMLNFLCLSHSHSFVNLVSKYLFGSENGRMLCFCYVIYESFRFFYLFFYFIWMQDPIIRPIYELDSDALEELLPEIPLWVKHPDFDRVGNFVGLILFSPSLNFWHCLIDCINNTGRLVEQVPCSHVALSW